MYDKQKANQVFNRRFRTIMKSTIKDLHATKERESLILFINEVQENLKPEVSWLGFPEIVELTAEEASKLQNQESLLPSFPFELVIQSASAGCEDCYHGYMYYPLKENQFIKIEFQC